MAKTSGGVRGGSSSKGGVRMKVNPFEPKRGETPKQKASKPSRPKGTRESRLVDFIRVQTGIDINKYRRDYTREMDGRRGINIRFKEMPLAEIREIYNLGERYKKFRLRESGATTLLLQYKR